MLSRWERRAARCIESNRDRTKRKTEKNGSPVSQKRSRADRSGWFFSTADHHTPYIVAGCPRRDSMMRRFRALSHALNLLSKLFVHYGSTLTIPLGNGEVSCRCLRTPLSASDALHSRGTVVQDGASRVRNTGISYESVFPRL